eukprot:SAG31_NODE_34740_length_329_cov_15.752174_1_plen_32_part_10
MENGKFVCEYFHIIDETSWGVGEAASRGPHEV